MQRRLVLAAVCALITLPAVAAAPPALPATGQDVNGDPVVLAVGVSGKVQGPLLTLSIEPGPIATQAIRIYSEPSHTLLAAVVSPEFKASPAGAEWRQARLEGAKGPLVTTDLPAGRPKVQVPARPADDDRIAVWVRGLFPRIGSGEPAEAEMLVADGKVGSGDFSFRTSFPLNPPPELVEDPQHCCTAASGCETCANCAARPSPAA